MPIYVDSNASGADNGTSWINAYQTLALCETGEAPYAVDQEIWLAHDHAESTAGSLAFAFANGTATQPVRLISVNSGTDNYEAGATITATVSTSDITIGTGASTWLGVTFVTPDNFGFNATTTTHSFYECTFNAADTPMELLQTYICIECYDCTIISADTSLPGIVLNRASGHLLIRGGSITMASAASASAMFLANAADSDNILVVEDCDLSGGGTTTANMVLTALNVASLNNTITFRRCKLPASYTTQTMVGGNVLQIESCSGGTDTVPFLGVTEWQDQHGVVQSVTTDVRTGGASDGDQLYAWEMNPVANVSYYAPLESPPIVYWAEAGAQTVTIHIANDVDLDTDQCWITIEHPSEATPAEPDHIVLTTKPAPLVTGNAITRDSGSTWSGAGTGTDGSTGQQKLVSASFNPVEAGPVIIRVYLATDDTMYVDPKPVVA